MVTNGTNGKLYNGSIGKTANATGVSLAGQLWPTYSGIGSIIPSKKATKNNVVIVGPTLTKLSGNAHGNEYMTLLRIYILLKIIKGPRF